MVLTSKVSEYVYGHLHEGYEGAEAGKCEAEEEHDGHEATSSIKLVEQQWHPGEGKRGTKSPDYSGKRGTKSPDCSGTSMCVRLSLKRQILYTRW